jgi:hypothetical protein
VSQAARQAAAGHGLLAGVQADAGVLIDEFPHPLEVGAGKANSASTAWVARWRGWRV